MRPLAVFLLALPLAASAQTPADEALASETTVVQANSSTVSPGRAALQAYLDAHPAYSLRAESAFEPLIWMRAEEDMGPDFHPYVLDGDFNRDGYADFAAIVFGPLSGTQGAWGNNASYDTRVLVFNGQPDGTASLAVGDADGEFPLSTFLGVEADGAGLWYGVAETDALVILTPNGDTYDSEIPEMGD